MIKKIFFIGLATPITAYAGLFDQYQNKSESVFDQYDQTKNENNKNFVVKDVPSENPQNVKRYKERKLAMEISKKRGDSRSVPKTHIDNSNMLRKDSFLNKCYKDLNATIIGEDPRLCSYPYKKYQEVYKTKQVYDDIQKNRMNYTYNEILKTSKDKLRLSKEMDDINSCYVKGVKIILDKGCRSYLGIDPILKDYVLDATNPHWMKIKREMDVKLKQYKSNNDIQYAYSNGGGVRERVDLGDAINAAYSGILNKIRHGLRGTVVVGYGLPLNIDRRLMAVKGYNRFGDDDIEIKDYLLSYGGNKTRSFNAFNYSLNKCVENGSTVQSYIAELGGEGSYVSKCMEARASVDEDGAPSQYENILPKCDAIDIYKNSCSKEEMNHDLDVFSSYALTLMKGVDKENLVKSYEKAYKKLLDEYNGIGGKGMRFIPLDQMYKNKYGSVFEEEMQALRQKVNSLP